MRMCSRSGLAAALLAAILGAHLGMPTAAADSGASRLAQTATPAEPASPNAAPAAGPPPEPQQGPAAKPAAAARKPLVGAKKTKVVRAPPVKRRNVYAVAPQIPPVPPPCSDPLCGIFLMLGIGF